MVTVNKVGWCPGPESNRHGIFSRGILSPLRLPVPPPGQFGYIPITFQALALLRAYLAARYRTRFASFLKSDGYKTTFLVIHEARVGIEPASTALQAAA